MNNNKLVITFSILFASLASNQVLAERQIQSQIKINASPEHVWSVLIDFKNYPQWSKFITTIGMQSKSASLPEVGKKLQVFIVPPNEDGMKFNPKIIKLSQTEELRWKGNVGGMSFLFAGEHYFQLASTEDNGTILTHGEDFSGLMLPLLWGKISKNTPAGFIEFNESIKHRAEADL